MRRLEAPDFQPAPMRRKFFASLYRGGLFTDVDEMDSEMKPVDPASIAHPKDIFAPIQGWVPGR
jgi:hypothetical protein